MPSKDVHQLESKIQRKILNYLNTIPNLYVVRVMTANIRGVPDLLICYKGHFIALEVKSDIGTVTKIQQYNMSQIETAGGKAAVVRSVGDVIKFLLELENMENGHTKI